MILVLLDPEPGLARLIAEKRHHVLLAYGGSPHRTDVTRLERPFPEWLETALRSSGVPEDKARNLARDSSRSLAILRRLMSSQPGRLPAWAQQPPPRALLAAFLAGGWDESSKADKAALSRLADMPYDEIVAALPVFTGSLDEPLRKVGSVWKVASPKDAWMLLAPSLATPNVDRFEGVICDVLGTSDPRYQMDPNDRWYAAVKGVRPEYSAYLRHGLGQTLILLGIEGRRAATVADIEQRPPRVVRRLLEHADGERWWSLTDDFQLLAEASPDAFLDAVEASLEQKPSPIAALFGSDANPLFGGEHLSDLLWALESLAWSTDYLTRVALLLAGLDAIDPGGRQGNRPRTSLRQIFILWLPQTSATFDERFRVIDVLRRRYPDPAWRLLLGILPVPHDAFSPSAKPRWRDFASAQEESITWAQAGQAVSQRVLEDVGTQGQRWAHVLDRIGAFPNPTTVIGQLARVAPDLESDRASMWSKLRQILHHHRQIPDAAWRLRDCDLDALEAIYEALAPTDPIERNVWLFRAAPALPHPLEKWEDNAQKLAGMRQTAALSILAEQGTQGIFQLALALDDARDLGIALTQGELDKPLLEAIVERALQSDSPREHSLASGLIVATTLTESRAWLEDLFRRAQSQGWGDKALLTILRAVRSSRWVWDLAHAAGHAVEMAYWQELQPYINEPQAGEADWIFAAEQLIAAGRAERAAELIGNGVVKADVPSRVVVDILTAAAQQPVNPPGAARSDATMLQYYIANLFKRLDEADDVGADTLAKLEWIYLPLLEYSDRKPKVILKSLARLPQFFVELICALYSPTEESGVIEPPPQDMDRAKKIATQAHNVLRLWNIVPGNTDNGALDAAALRAWITEARALAAAKGRTPIADQKIGEVLAWAGHDEDGHWPARAVREVIEALKSPDVDVGVLIGRQNLRGVTGRLPRDGGSQERMEAKHYRRAAKATAIEWPRTSALLKKIAEEFDQHARWHDDAVEYLDWQ